MQLARRKEELDRRNEKIEELMYTLDQQKYEAILFTFKQVGKYFSEIFQELAPKGRAMLVKEPRTAKAPRTTITEPDPATIFSELGDVCGPNDGAERDGSTVGWTKDLVALALIFAIQRCDPAPFYLFDEIDQALDPQHREAVAKMIHELSADAQFITTTFKPEMIRQANKFNGVTYRNKVSHIECVTQDEAAEFVEGDPDDGQ